MDSPSIVIEQHPDGYVAYSLDLRGVVAQGNTHAEALADLRSAMAFHLETFGQQDISSAPPPSHLSP